MWHTRRIAPGMRLQHQPPGEAWNVVAQLEEPHGVHLAKSRQMPMSRWSARRFPGGEGRRKRHGRVRSLRTAGESGIYIYIHHSSESFLFHGFPFVVGVCGSAQGCAPRGFWLHSLDVVVGARVLSARRVWILVLGGGTDFDDHRRGRYSCPRLAFLFGPWRFCLVWGGVGPRRALRGRVGEDPPPG